MILGMVVQNWLLLMTVCHSVSVHIFVFGAYTIKNTKEVGIEVQV